MRNSHGVGTGSLVVGRSRSVLSGNVRPGVDRVNFRAGVNSPCLRKISCHALPEFQALRWLTEVPEVAVAVTVVV